MIGSDPTLCPRCGRQMRLRGGNLCSGSDSWMSYLCVNCNHTETVYPNRNQPAQTPPTRPPMQSNEIHICSHDNGHEKSVDCWCEPVTIAWVKNKHGVNVLVVEHDDANHIVAQMHRSELVALRERARYLVAANFRTDTDAWITRALTPPWTDDPNPRSL